MNIDDVVKRYLPSAPEARIESGTTRVLHELRARPPLAAAQVAKPVPALRWKRIAMIPVAAAVVLAVFVGLMWRQDALAIGEGDDGSVYRIGDTVRTKATVTINLNDGSRVEVKSDSELSFEGSKSAIRINLMRGGVAVLQGEAHVQQGLVARTLVAGEQIAAQIPPHRETFDVISIHSRANNGGGGQRGLGGAEGGSGGPCAAGKVEIDPSRYSATNIGFYALVTVAYGLGNWGLGEDAGVGDVDGGAFTCRVSLDTGRLSGGPEWIQSTRFDIEATIPDGSATFIVQPGNKGAVRRRVSPRVQRMLQAMLEDRFQLRLRAEMKELPVYVLSVAPSGPNLTPWKEGDWIGVGSSPASPYDGRNNGPETTPQYNGLIVGQVQGGRMPISSLAERLARITNRPVLDRTGIQGYFNWGIFFTPLQVPVGETGPILSSPSLFKAVQEEVGLQLESAKAPVKVVVIENAEKPSEN